MQSTEYEPKEDDLITVDLPDERTRGRIVSVISNRSVIARIEQFTTGGKSHNYKRNDLVACRFERDPRMNLNVWRAIPEGELERAEEIVAPTPVQEPDKPIGLMREMDAADIMGHLESAPAPKAKSTPVKKKVPRRAVA
jgi:hypothetical protein